MTSRSAAASLTGYTYQFYCALLLMLESKDEKEMTLETVDDVVLDEKGIPTDLFQIKHHLDSASMLTDRSNDLWRTIANWSNLLYEGKLRPSDLNLTIITTSKAQYDSAVSLLRIGNTRNTQEVKKRLELISKEKSGSNKEYYEEFLKLDDYQKHTLVNAMYVIDSFPNIQNIEHEIMNKIKWGVYPQKEKEFFNGLLGWWIHQNILRLNKIENNNITKSEIRAKILDLYKQFRDDNLPIYYDESDVDESKLASDTENFVRQLVLVDASEDLKKGAKSDFYLASANRSEWVRKEPMVKSELKLFDDSLKRDWKIYSQIRISEIGEQAIEKTKKLTGRKILEWAYFNTDHLCIRPLCKAPFIRRGSFHILADIPELGWHPDYEKTIKRKVEVL